jgi:hypothetical protein
MPPRGQARTLSPTYTANSCFERKTAHPRLQAARQQIAHPYCSRGWRRATWTHSVTLSESEGWENVRRAAAYARQPGRPDDWLAPRRTGCSASGHSPQPNGPANALDLPMSAHTRRNGPGCRSTGDQWLRRSGQPRGPGFTSGPRGAAPRPRLRSMRRPAWSDLYRFNTHRMVLDLGFHDLARQPGSTR